MDWLHELMKDDFGKAIVTVCGTLIVTGFGVFIGGFKDILVDSWKHRRSRKYNAMLLATTIDQFITDCVDLITDEGYTMPDGSVHSSVKRPSEIVWPSALDWPSITPDIMYRCLLLPAELRSAEDSIDFVAQNIAGPPDYEEFFEEVQLGYSVIGLGAVHILNRIRDDFGVQTLDRGEMDPRKIFMDKITEVKKIHDDRGAEQLKWRAEMDARIAADAELAKSRPDIPVIERLMASDKKS